MCVSLESRGVNHVVTSTPERSEQLSLPNGLTDSKSAARTVFLDTNGIDLQRADGQTLENVNAALYEALKTVCESPLSEQAPLTGQTLLKIHIGEPKCGTRMRPEFARAAADFARQNGASIVAGDTTVAYTGGAGTRTIRRGTLRRIGHWPSNRAGPRTGRLASRSSCWIVRRPGWMEFSVFKARSNETRSPGSNVSGIFTWQMALPRPILQSITLI